MGKPTDDCYWFISVLETGDVASLHYIQTFFFHIRCHNSNKNPSNTDTIHHTTFFPNLQIPTPPSDTNARHIKLNQWVNINVLGCANIKCWLILALKDAIRGYLGRILYTHHAPLWIPTTQHYAGISRADSTSNFPHPWAWIGETLDGCNWFIDIHEMGVFHSLHHTLTHLLIGCLNIEAESVRHSHISAPYCEFQHFHLTLMQDT